MKILYAVQGTGNGHISRAIKIYPLLTKHAEVDVLISGNQYSVPFEHPIAHQLHGFSFVFGKSGNVDIINTAKIFKPFRLWSDIRQVPVQDYDLIVNDFEPVTAYACRRKGIPTFGLSHQASFLSDKTPRYDKSSKFFDFIINTYAPVDDYVGFHFKEYDEKVSTPIIRDEIRHIKTTEGGHCNVYLPAYANETLVKHLSKVRGVTWRVFSKAVKQLQIVENVELHPISSSFWIESLAASQGVIMGGGFEGPSECLHLGKKMLVLPMLNQYEQMCNGKALQLMGVAVEHGIKKTFSDRVADWLMNDKPLTIQYPDRTEDVVASIFR